MATLYEINTAIEDAFNRAINVETGEITDEDALRELDALQMERDRKIENVGLWIKDLRAEAEALKAEKQAFEKRQRVTENKIEALKKYLMYALNGNKFKTTRLSVSYRKTESVEIDDAKALPPDYAKITYEPRRDLIKKAIKTGGTITGARIVEGKSIIIK